MSASSSARVSLTRFVVVIVVLAVVGGSEETECNQRLEAERNKLKMLYQLAVSKRQRRLIKCERQNKQC